MLRRLVYLVAAFSLLIPAAAQPAFAQLTPQEFTANVLQGEPDTIDPQVVAYFKGINIKDLHTAYRQFCKNETVAKSPVDLAAVVDFYNKTLADLPDETKLKGLKLPGTTFVLDGKGQRFAEIFEADQRRVWVTLGEIPLHVQKALLLRLLGRD